MKAIQKQKNSSSGNIPTRFLKDAAPCVSTSLSIIFSKSLAQGKYLDNLKLARISAIYKGKGSKSNPDNYRPISVLSAVARLFEKLVHQQFFPHLKGLLLNNQSGFKPGHSTETSLLNTTNKWIINIDNGCLNLTLFLDLRKAFDTIDHKILLEKLDYYGIKDNDLSWFESYLSNRNQYCSIEGHESAPKINPAGIPQGSSLGPILFLVYINDLSCSLEHSETNLFADDTNLTCVDKMLCKAQEKLNKDLVELGNWLSANKLSANLVKTEYMILGTAPKLKALDYSPMIKLSGKSIKRVIKSDYQGLIIDESLSWKQYISSLKLKISSALMAIKQVDFLPQESLITLYHSLVESRLRYCNTVWGNCGISLKNQLQRLQDRAARIVDKKNGTENPLFKLGWLDVQQQIDFDTAVMVHKTLNKTAPSYFSEMFQEVRSVHNHDTRGSRCGLFPTHCNLKTGQQSFSHYGCSVWNKIDRDVQEITNVDCFKKNKKNHV